LVNRDDAVRAQYEGYPYPARDPADEARRLVIGSPSHLDEINHYLFAGARSFGAGAPSFRALIAGGGTGDGAIMLAQQLADAGGDGEVVHLDLSKASSDIAKARAKARKLRNIRFEIGSLLELEGLGRFDYIDCCGVLHHLADPQAGLRSLAGALTDDGGMGLMVYGTYGRTGVYHVQDALKLLAGDHDDGRRLKQARALLADLPETNWLKRNPWLADHLHGDDAGLYDLLLHARDRAYTVPEVFDFVTAAGLAITNFIEPARYDPATYLRDEALLATADALPWPERCALAELLAGSIKRHVFYVAKGDAEERVARPDSGDIVPLLREGDAAQMAQGMASTRRLNADLDGVSVSHPVDRLAPAILSRVDGKRSISEIHTAMTSTVDWAVFKAAFDRLYAILNGINVLLLRR
jgi:SAM-dependent methyltransferase